MEVSINGGSAFSHLHIALAPGETVTAEAGAMASMSAELDIQAKPNGSVGSALTKRFLGGESFFVNEFTNRASAVQTLTLTQSLPGQIRQLTLANETFYLQPGAYLASTGDIQLGLGWAGLVSGFSREGFFRLTLSGTGTVWFGAFGAMLERPVDGSLLVDTGHLVGYSPGLELKMQLAGGLIASLTSGEGLVTRVEGHGKVILQTRSLSGLVGWLNPKLSR